MPNITHDFEDVIQAIDSLKEKVLTIQRGLEKPDKPKTVMYGKGRYKTEINLEEFEQMLKRGDTKKSIAAHYGFFGNDTVTRMGQVIPEIGEILAKHHRFQAGYIAKPNEKGFRRLSKRDQVLSHINTIRKMRQAGIGIKAIARACGVSSPTLYKYVRTVKEVYDAWNLVPFNGPLHGSVFSNRNNLFNDSIMSGGEQ